MLDEEGILEALGAMVAMVAAGAAVIAEAAIADIVGALAEVLGDKETIAITTIVCKQA